MDIRVQCQPGHRSEPAPSRFFVGARRVDAVDVLDRWPASDHCYFKVRGDDHGLYILRHDLPSDRWELTVYRDEACDGETGNAWQREADRARHGRHATH